MQFHKNVSDELSIQLFMDLEQQAALPEALVDTQVRGIGRQAFDVLV